MPDREKVIECLQKAKMVIETWVPMFEQYNTPAGIDDAIAMLKEQETVVRCKDCIHATMTADGKMCKYCEMDTDDCGDQRVVYHDADWFCADGERK